jgi:hypothetical protein
MRTCFSKQNLQKRCPKKKSVHKKQFEKNGKNIFSKNTQSSHLRAQSVFCFFKTKIFFSKKKVSKLSVFENGYFWLCPQIRFTKQTSPPHGNAKIVFNYCFFFFMSHYFLFLPRNLPKMTYIEVLKSLQNDNICTFFPSSARSAEFFL